MYLVQLAWRYASSRWVNLVAVLAIALALTVQIVVMAVLDGMLADMERRVRGLGEQITIRFYGDMPDESEFLQASSALTSIPGVKGATPLISGYGMLECQKNYAPLILYGIDLAMEMKYSELPKHLQDVRLDPSTPVWIPDEGKKSGQFPGIYIGAQVAEKLGAVPGDLVTFSFARPGEDEMKRTTFRFVSTFRSGSPLKDEWGGYVPLAAARSIFLTALPEETPVPIISVWLEDPKQADALEPAVRDAVVASIQHVSPTDIRTYTWQKKWHSMSAGMAHENTLQEIIMVLMNLSGGFCVFAIMATLVGRRIRDVGLLRCLGAHRREVVFVFIQVGFFIGLVGALLGVCGGYYAAPRIDGWWEAITGAPLYPPRMFGIEGLPILIVHWKVVVYAFGATLIAVLASLYPALWAGRREPVEALRDE